MRTYIMETIEKTTEFTAQEFWSFSLYAYGKNKVKEQLLMIQNDCQGNVNLSLMCLWLDTLGFKLPVEHFDQLEKALFPTTKLLILYRQSRRMAKVLVSEKEYQQLQDIELTIEKKQQQDLIDNLPKEELKQHETPHNYAFYLSRLDERIV